MEAATQTDPATGNGTKPLADDPRPLGEYAALMGLYNAGMAGYLWWRGRRGGPTLPERIGPGDLALMATSTHKVSRLIAKDKVTAPLRAPFTEYEGEAGPAEAEESATEANGPRKA